MAVPVLASSGLQTYSTGSGTATYTFTAETGVKSIVVVTAHEKGGVAVTGVTWGNLALTKVAEEAPGVGSSHGRGIQAWALGAVSGRDDDVVRVAYSSSFPNDAGGQWAAYQVGGTYDSVASNHNWDYANNLSVAQASATEATIICVANVSTNYSSMTANLTVDIADTPGSKGPFLVGYDEDAAIGQVSGVVVSSVVEGDTAVIIVSVADLSVVRPSTVSVNVAVQTTGLSVDVGASTMLLPSPPTRVRVSVQTAGLAITATAQRQVALVGGGLWTPQMTTGGTEGQVLTQHTKSPPTWEDATGGGGGDTSLVVELSVSGAHEVDYADGSTHDLTLTGDATISLAGALTDLATDLRLILRQDGTGSRTVTWPGSVEWAGGSAPTLQTAANAVDTIGLLSVDDGTTWLGYYVDTAGDGTAATTVESETTLGIAAAVGTDTEYARQDHTHGSPSISTLRDAGRWEVLLIEDGSEPLSTEDGLDWLYVWVTD